ncbi:MAG: DUF6356 family protein [Hyphomicrobiales bacterium]|nr:DUF6356 family protein [Hyphomicrobiales bacterium]
MNTILSAFNRHPQSIGESYGEHAVFAGQFGFTLLLAGLAALVHAVLPFAFEKTAGNMIIKLHGKIANRGR